MNRELNSIEKARVLVNAELSLKKRLGYVGLLLVSAAMTAVVISLWLTEPSLPLRTQAAFGAMSVIGVSWCAFAAWVLRARRPLFARDRVIAGGMAVGFTAVFAAAALAAALTLERPAAFIAFGTGLVMLAGATGLLINARRRFAALMARKLDLERTLAS